MSKYIFAILGSLVMSTLAFADDTKPVNEVYKYGDKIDIVKVVSLSKIPTDLCEAVPATMTYVDSSGVERTMEYQVLADGCTQ